MTLNPDLCDLIRACAKDESGYQTLVSLFSETQQQPTHYVNMGLQTDLMCRFLPDTTLTYVNPAYCRFYNRSAEELVGHSFLLLLAEPDRERVRQSIVQYIQSPTTAIYENPGVRYDGAVRHLQWLRWPIFNQAGELIEIQSVGRDITEHRQASAAQPQSESCYRQMVESAPDGIMIVRETVILYANAALMQMLGIKHHEDLIGKTVFDILAPAYHELTRERIAALGHDQEIALRRHEHYVCVDGSLIDVEVTITPIVVENRPASAVFVTDISQQIQNETLLRQFQDQLRALQQLSIELSKTRSFDDFCRQAVEGGRAYLGFDRLGLWFLSADRRFIYGSFGTDVNGQTLDERSQRHPTDDYFPGMRFNETYYLDYDDHFELKDAWGNVIGIGWHAMTALWNGNEVIGFLSADNLLNQRPAQPQQMELLVLYGATLGHLATRLRAEETVRASDEAERKFHRQLRLLHEISIELTRADSFKTLCRQAIELGRSRLGFDRLSMWFIDDEDSQYMHGSFGTDEHGHLRDEWDLRFHILDSADQLTWQILLGKHSALLDYDTELYNDTQQPIGRGWVATAGLMDGAQVIGCLYADNLISQQPPERYTLELLRLYGVTLGHLATRIWAEEALRHSEQRYRAIVEGAGIGICVTDAQGHLIESNPVFQHMVGYSYEELQTMRFADFTHPEDRDQNLRLFENLIAGVVPHYRYEKRYIRKDGQPTWVRVNVSPFPGTHTTDRQTIAMIEDINEQRRTEAQLRESEARHRALLEAIPDLILLLSIDGIFLDFHAPSESVLMLPPEQFLNRHFAEVMPPNVAEKTEFYMARIRETGQMQIHEYTLNTDSGERHYESRMVSYGAQRVLAIIRDITEQKQAETQLRESEARFRQIADHVDEVFFIQDPINQKTLYINPAYEKIWQRPTAELLNNPMAFMEAIHPDDIQRVRRNLESPNQENNLKMEYRIIQPDGTVRWIWVRNTLFRDASQRINRVVGVAKDITERKQMEQNNIELGLQRERIRLISDFVRDASHQFRTPLSIINSKVYLAGKTDKPETRLEMLQSIQEQSNNILRLIESLVAMARLDSDEALSLSQVNLDQIIQIVCLRRSDEAANAEIALTYQPGTDGALLIDGDVDELYQAVSLLIDNALRYTPAHGRITLRTYRQNPYIAVAVEDTGSGIPANELPHIFERFFRGAAAYSLPGFGLGLPMAKKIVERHGGRIEVQSQPGQGSTFTILLPAQKAAD
jgi:PAS domain S-box-containing protein